MFDISQIRNDFYQGLSLLLNFEEGNSHGAMSIEHFAINKIIGHFSAALEDGDIIAPFFLHYIADKYKGYIDKSALPQLKHVPTHRQSGRDWLRAYEQYLSINEKIASFSNRNTIVANSQREANSKVRVLRAWTKSMLSEIAHVAKIPGGLSNYFAAKLMEKFSTIQDIDRSLIRQQYELAAFYPNVIGMYALWNDIQKTGNLNPSNPKHAKLIFELQSLKDSGGDFFSLAEHYLEEQNLRYFSQWQFVDVMHGNTAEAFSMMEAYVSGGIKWRTPLSKKEELAEAIKWFDWLLSCTSDERMPEFWQLLTNICENYADYINGIPNKATFLAYCLYQMNVYFLSHPELASNQDAATYLPAFMSFREIIMEAYNLNHRKLPYPLSQLAMLNNEVGIIWEQREDHEKAEVFYTKALQLEPSNVNYQYNLANNLDIQGIHIDKQIAYYLAAAKQGCMDSLNRLFYKTVVLNCGTEKDLGQVIDLCSHLISDEDLPIPRSLMIQLLKITYYQRYLASDEAPIIDWHVDDTDGGMRCWVSFNEVSQRESLSSSDDEEEVKLIENTEPKHDKEEAPKPALGDSRETSRKERQTTVKAKIEKPDCIYTSCESDIVFFKPQKLSKEKKLSAKQARAIRTLETLNDTPTRSLTLGDFVEARKAYNIIVGESGHIQLSQKGRTSGSRIEIGGQKFHMPHGRDRASIGAQSSIKKIISSMHETASAQLNFKGLAK